MSAFTFNFERNRKTPLLVLLAEAKRPYVEVGGKALRDLREDFFDNARNSCFDGRKAAPIESVYDIALCGGEPYAVWS